MLSGCHERVERTLRLLARFLVEHAGSKGRDAQARSANDVLRYFDIAAPRPVKTKNCIVFPLLLTQADAAHFALANMYGACRPIMCRWAQCGRVAPPLQAVAAGVSPPPSLGDCG